MCAGSESPSAAQAKLAAAALTKTIARETKPTSKFLKQKHPITSPSSIPFPIPRNAKAFNPNLNRSAEIWESGHTSEAVRKNRFPRREVGLFLCIWALRRIQHDLDLAEAQIRNEG
jgi:hypothetical protein